MGDYVPLKLELEKKKLVNSTELSENRYNYAISGREEGIIKNLEFLTSQKKISLFITSKYNIKEIDPYIKELDDTEVKSLFNSKYLITSSTLRKDGRLSAITMENGECSALNIESKTTIRRFNKSEEVFVSVAFSFDKSKLIIGTTTGKIVLYEISTNDCLSIKSAHTDVIKCILPIDTHLGISIDKNFGNSNLKSTYFATCSYDLDIHLWCFSDFDENNEISKKSFSKNSNYQLRIIKSYRHNFPVECIGITNENILISCGGTSIKMWNLNNTDLKCVHTISDFGRAIVSLSLNKDLFVVGCLDHNVYLYNAISYKFIRSFGFNKGITKVAISECSTFIAIGLDDYSWIIKKKVNSLKEQITLNTDTQELTEIVKSYQTGTARYFKRGKEIEAEEQDIKLKVGKNCQTKIDRLLRSYSYKKAIDMALKMNWSYFVTVLQLLSSRGALHLVAREGDCKRIVKILKYLCKNIGKSTPSQFILISELIEHIIYENNLMKNLIFNNETENILEISDYVKRISQKVSLEIKQHMILREFRGIIETIIQNCKKSLTS